MIHKLIFILKHDTFWSSPRTSCTDGLSSRLQCEKINSPTLAEFVFGNQALPASRLRRGDWHEAWITPGSPRAELACRQNSDLHLKSEWDSHLPHQHLLSRVPHGFSRDTGGRSRVLPQPPLRPGDRSCPGEHHPGTQPLDPSTSSWLLATLRLIWNTAIPTL